MLDHKAIARIITGQWANIVERCNRYEIRQLNAIRRCRTSSMGGRLYCCDHCGRMHRRYYSCRNRHCPQCQNTQKEQWIEARSAELLPAKYYHIVFTLPHCLNQLCLAYKSQMNNLLFCCAWKTLDSFGWNPKYLGAQLGTTMVLHSWGSNLSYHPHVHCIVPGGGVTLKGKWKQARGRGRFLFPVKALSKVFRGKYVSELKKFLESYGMEYTCLLHQTLYKEPWVVYAKPPFGGAEGVVRYLARYTHHTAISNDRIKSYDEDYVSFCYTDYRHGNQRKVMKLSAWEFVRRFTQHFLPKGFTRIRHFGILSSAWKSRLFPLDIPKEKKDFKQIWKERGLDLEKCPHCKKGTLLFVETLPRKRGPPEYEENIKSKPVEML